MATPIRRRIRDTAIATLAAHPGLQALNAHVFPMRDQQPLLQAELPALLVLVDDGRGTYAGVLGNLQDRRAALVVELVVEQDHGGAYDDVIEGLAAELELALAADPQLGGAIKQFGEWTLGSKRTEAVGQLLVTRQTWQVDCLFYAPFGQPDVTL